MSKAVFGLLLAAVFAQVWFASTPLPFGGPNALLAGLAVLGAVVLRFVVPLLGARGAEEETRGAVLVQRLRDLRPIAPILIVCGLVLAWAVAVSAANGHWDYRLLGEMAFGTSLLCAVFLTVDSVRRATVFALAILAAIAASALFGALLLLFGEPFTSAWLWLAQVPDEQLRMLLRGSSSGLARHASTFGTQLSVAIPVALSAVAWCALRERAGGVWRVAVSYVLFAVVVTMLLVSGSRASVVGTIAGVVAAAWLWLLLGNERRKTAVVMALAVAALVALWLVFAWAGILGTSAPADKSRIRGLVADADALRRDETLVGHRFLGHRPGVRYEVGLQEQYVQGRSRWTHALAQADADGGIVLAWRPSEVGAFVGYRFRSRARGGRAWHPPRSSEYFLPSLPSPAQQSVCAAQRRQGTNPRLAIADLNASQVDVTAWSGVGSFWNKLARRTNPNTANRVGAVVYLPSGVEQAVQVRACSSDGFGPADQTRVDASPAARLWSLTWRESTAAPVAYQFRSRAVPQGTWSDWGNVWPVKYLRGPKFGSIGIGGRTLIDSPPAVGHEFRGLAEGYWYVVQIRVRRLAGFAPALQVSAKPDLRGKLALAWPAPQHPASAVGHQYRLRKAGQGEWSPWRDFQPTLSSEVPVPEPLAAEAGRVDDGRVRRHTLTGLVPGFAYGVQLRARNEYGHGAESEVVFHEAREDGTLPLRWRDTAGASPATGYQFRLWQNGAFQWWQDLDFQEPNLGHTRALTVDVLSEGEDEQLAFAHTARHVAGTRMALQRRLSAARLLNESAHIRIWQVSLALRYALDHPLGTGAFAPERRHMDDETDYSLASGLPPEEPHNQFLHMLVLFGVPGLVLHILFYALVARAAGRCARIAARPPTPAFRFLCASAVGACVAYFAGSLLLPNGPLLHDWDHFFAIGLLFSLPSIAAQTRIDAGTEAKRYKAGV